MFSKKDIFVLAVKIEENAAAVYAKAADDTEDADLTAMLLCLIRDEKRHARRFYELLKRSPKIEGPPQLEQLGQALIRDVIGKRSFSLGEANFGKIDQPEELLTLAVDFERDKINFYRLLQSFAADEAAFNALEAIISEEADHIEHLRQMLACRKEKRIAAECAMC